MVNRKVLGPPRLLQVVGAAEAVEPGVLNFPRIAPRKEKSTQAKW